MTYIWDVVEINSNLDKNGSYEIESLLEEMEMELRSSRVLAESFNSYKIQADMRKLEAISGNISKIKNLVKEDLDATSRSSLFNDLMKIRKNLLRFKGKYEKKDLQRSVHVFPPSFKHDLLPNETVKYSFFTTRIAHAGGYIGWIFITNKRILYDMRVHPLFRAANYMGLGLLSLLVKLRGGTPAEIVPLSDIYEAQVQIRVETFLFKIRYILVKRDKDGQKIIRGGKPVGESWFEIISVPFSPDEYLRDIKQRAQEICDAFNAMKAKG